MSQSVPCKVLFFGATPDDEVKLALDEECREIENKIQQAKGRDNLTLVTRWATRPDDLLNELNRHEPHVVHFSGHGSKANELILLDKDRQPKAVTKQALTTLFAALKGNIRLVMLNACYSKGQAEAITAVIDCAIGMKDTICDSAAITFAAAFYRALGYGTSVKNAFDQGISALMLEDIPAEDIPVLHTKEGIDPDAVVLVPSHHPQ